MPRGIASDPAKDKRRLPLPEDRKRGGRPRKAGSNIKTFSVKVSVELYTRLKALPEDTIREALGRL